MISGRRVRLEGSEMTQAIEVRESTVSGRQSYGGKPFPVVLECTTPSVTLAGATAWLSTNAADLVRRSEEAGAVLFRGFPVETPEDFDAFVVAFDLPNFPYYE